MFVKDSDSQELNELKEAIIGKRIINVTEDTDRLFEDMLCIDEIELEGGIILTFDGRADRTMIFWEYRGDDRIHRS